MSNLISVLTDRKLVKISKFIQVYQIFKSLNRQDTRSLVFLKDYLKKYLTHMRSTASRTPFEVTLTSYLFLIISPKNFRNFDILY